MRFDPEGMLARLQAMADDRQADLEAGLRPRLDDREQRVLDWVLARFRDPSRRRWWDPHHALFSAAFACELVAAEGLDRLVVPATLLHDAGYGAIADKGRWDSRESRILHQQEGTPLAARALAECGYSPAELETAVGMVAVHDNPYLGIAIHGRDRLGVRDCDRAWVLCALSFYREVAAAAERWARPGEYLQERAAQFQEAGPGAAPDPHREVPTYRLTRERVLGQIERRAAELELWAGDEAAFWARVEVHIAAETG